MLKCCQVLDYKKKEVEKMEQHFKTSDLESIFINWSHGTFYNRLKSLQIQNNPEYTVKNINGNVFFNQKAIDLLEKQYLKEFTHNTLADKKELDKVINDYLSNKSIADKNWNMPNNSSKKNDNIDNIDKFDNIKNVNTVKDSSSNEDTVSKIYHIEIVDSLKKQIELLEKQLEKQTEANQDLIDTIKLREQKEAVIEQQKLVELQQHMEVKRIEQQTTTHRKSLFNFFRKSHPEETAKI